MNRIDCFKRALPEELLQSSNFFELYPFDGGGYFVHHSLLGTIDDREISRKILRENALKDFGPLARLDLTKFERWSTIEQSCWINRMYFLVPLARVAALENDAATATLVKEMVLYFLRNYPPPQGKEAVCEYSRRILECRDRDYNEGSASLDSPIEYQWFDFQPASRIVNIVNAMSFLRHFPVISADEWKEIDRFIYDNAEIIYLDEAYRCPLACGNHQALRGLALLYGAAYFDGEDFAAVWLKKALEIINFHFENDYFKDGVLKEISPSYHVFETWIIRDAFLLARQYRFPLTEVAAKVLENAFKVCRTLTQPNGCTIVIDDGYSLNTDAFLKSFPVEAVSGGSVLLNETEIAISRSEKWFAVLDSSSCPHKYSHYHAGKNGVTLWYENRPFLVDSNCCSYDLPEFAEWYKLPQAHSTLLLDGQGDGMLAGRSYWSCWAEAAMQQIGENAFECALTSPVPAWEGVGWTRRLEVGKSVTIADRVKAGAMKKMEFILVLHPDVQVEIEADAIRLSNQVRLQLRWWSSKPVAWQVAPGKVFLDGIQHPSQRLIAAVEADELEFRMEFTPVI